MIKFKKDWPLKSVKLAPSGLRLEGTRIDLISPQLEDYEAWEKVRRRNQNFLKPYEPQWTKDALTKDFFKRRLKKQGKAMSEGRGVFFLIHDKKSNKIIGGINMNDIQYGAARYASLGYWLDKDLLRQGYMHEAGLLVIDYAFNTLKLHRLNAACLIANIASINLLLKLGFQEEGLAKKYLKINGKWQDHRLFGLINPNADF